VMERLTNGNRPAEGIPVSIDGRTVTTDALGRFVFSEVPEGAHKVELAFRELPAEFDPGQNTRNTVLVRPGKLSRADFDVVRLGLIQGKITAPQDVPVDDVVVRLSPGGRYTTPNLEGNFYFYNLREGEYEVAVDKNTLPEYATMDKSEPVSVSVRVGQELQEVNFQFDIRKPQKPIRKVLELK
jgi:hypothetical protein